MTTVAESSDNPCSEKLCSEKPWSEKTPDEKLAHRLACWLDPSVELVDEAAHEAYASRVRRLIDAIRLERTPDRVPVPLQLTEVYPLRWAGLTPRQGMYDFDRAGRAFVDFTLEFNPDALVSPLAGTLPGPVFEKVDYLLYSWPGYGAPEEATHQYHEKEWISAEDYDAFIGDPSDFMLRRYLPRICGGLRGFEKLRTALDTGTMAFLVGFFASWADPQVRESLQNMLAAGEAAAAYLGKFRDVVARMQGLGFPPYVSGAMLAPFDYLGDHLRGTKEIFLDLFRRPEKVKETCDRLAPLIVRWVLEQTSPDSPPLLFWPLHKGADGFMSDEQFKTFFWPTMREVMLGVIAEGFIPLCFAEGRWDSRLDVMVSDLPKGKTVWLLDKTEVKRAKAILGGVAAIQGNVSPSLLHAGTVEDVRNYCRELIEIAAEDGGFLLDSGCALYTAKPQNMHAMIAAARDFGTYHRD